MRGLVAAALWWASIATASAQPALNSQLVQSPAGELVGLVTPAAPTLGVDQLIWGVHVHHARRPLRLACLQAGECPGDGPLGTALRHLTVAELSVAFALAEGVEVGAVAGLGVIRGSRSEAQWRDPRWAAGVTDLRLSAKLRLLTGAVQLSALPVIELPTGAERDYLGSRGIVVMPAVLGDIQFGPARVASLVGYRFRERVQFGGLLLDDEIQASVAVDLALGGALGLLFESQLRVGLGGPAQSSNGRAVESQAGMRIDLADRLRLRFGLGTGVWPTPVGYGTSDLRFWADLRGRGPGAVCGGAVEALAACDEADLDGDGIVDGRDQCPGDAEDVDGFVDEDGCPDHDDDADGVDDVNDRCPSQAEDLDGYRDADGCPEPDNDRDSVPDGDDRCPMDPEDLDEYQDDDGCPEPGPQRTAITVTDSRILVSDRIYFEYDTEVIRAVSMPTLDEVARAILALGADRRVRVEGHTDSAGDPEYNLDLSFRRARTVVEYLVSRGVSAERLTHVGFGGTRPLAGGRSEDAQAINRRVEFAISTEAGGAPLKSQ